MSTARERATRRCRASLTVDLPAARAFELFTPEGERAWVLGWMPRYHASERDRSAPGTVFTTRHGNRVTTWLVVAREPGRRMHYARFDDCVGTVEVTVSPHGDADRAVVDVAYVLTPLDDHAEARLGGFAAQFPAMIAGWASEIERHLADAAAGAAAGPPTYG